MLSPTQAPQLADVVAAASALMLQLRVLSSSYAASLTTGWVVVGWALVMGFAQVELAGPLSIEPAEAVIDRFRALPADRFPRLVEIARAAERSDPAGELRQGLDLLLAGLSS